MQEDTSFWTFFDMMQYTLRYWNSTHFKICLLSKHYTVSPCFRYDGYGCTLSRVFQRIDWSIFQRPISLWASIKRWEMGAKVTMCSKNREKSLNCSQEDVPSYFVGRKYRQCRILSQTCLSSYPSHSKVLSFWHNGLFQKKIFMGVGGYIVQGYWKNPEKMPCP